MSKNWRRITNVPVEKFRARDGQFVCTFDVAGKKSVSLAMPADRLHELITSAAAHGLLVSADEYYGKWRALSRYFKTGSVRQREKSILAVIILSFTHPSGGVTTTKKNPTSFGKITAPTSRSTFPLQASSRSPYQIDLSTSINSNIKPKPRTSIDQSPSSQPVTTPLSLPLTEPTIRR